MQGRRSLCPRLASPLKLSRQPKKPQPTFLEVLEYYNSLGIVEDSPIVFEGDELYVERRRGYDTVEFNQFIFEETPQQPRPQPQLIMAGNCEEKTMGAFYRPVIGEVSSPIVMNDATRAYELKQNHFNLLPSFHGLANEDSLAFISDYCQALRSFPLSGLTEDQLKVRCFEYCLKDRAKSWLMSLPAESLESWADITKQFMLQYYPVKKTQEVRAKIMSFTQEHDEQFHEAYGRFKELLKQCPHHLFPPQLYWQLFYDGLAQPLQYMADNAAGGNIANVTATALEDIFETMAANSKQKSSRRGSASVSAVEPDHALTKQVASLMREVQQLKLKKNDTPTQQIQELGPCGICNDMGHDCDTCPNMGDFPEEGGAEAYAMQGFHTQQQTYEPPQQQFNSGWNRQPNSSWRNQNQGQGSGANNQFRRPPQYQSLAPPQQFGAPQQQFPVRPNRQQHYQAPHGQYQPPQQYQQPQRYQPPQPRPPAEDAFNSYMTTNDRRAESTEASLKRLEEAMGQIATTLSNLQQQHDKDKLSGQAHQAQAVTVLRSGKVIDNKVEMPVQTVPEKTESSKEKVDGLHKAADPYIPPSQPVRAPFTPHVPYPGRLRNVKQEQQFNDFYKLLSKVNVNLPLLDIIRNTPAYVKFFKELASKKRNLGDYDKVIVSETANSIMQLPLPSKLRDPGSFIITITLENGKEASGMLDLGAEINLMPHSIFQQLELGELKPTRMSLQLADRSVRYPKGIIEDVLMKVGGLIVPVDFVVLEVGEVHEDGKEHTLLLGRPFMATTNTLLDVKSGTIKMSVLGESVSFSVRGSLNAPSAHFVDDCSFIDVVDPLVEFG